MHDLKLIRSDPLGFKNAMQRRGEVFDVRGFASLDEESRRITTSLQDLQRERNTISDQLAALDKESAEFVQMRAKVLEINQKIARYEADSNELQARLIQTLESLPNALSPNVPDGSSEDENVVVATALEPRAFDFAPAAHFALGANARMMDFERTALLSGARFVSLFGQLARLERALGQFMLDLHVNKHGFTEVSVPELVRDQAMYGTGNLPKFGEEAFKTTDGKWLIPTAEVPLTNMVRESILKEEQLPLRYTALSRCFRSEAGSAGKDTRGMIRLHQFSKVELVTIATRSNYEEEFEHLMRSAESVLLQLNLPYQKVLKCTADTTTFSSEMTYDLEVWLPAQRKFREISSCSKCGQFAARRMNARYRGTADKHTTFVYTMNGSGLAVGRALVAVMENYQNKDGSITVPEVLREYMNCDVIQA